jgi:replication-associated recombination protein RarA
MNDPGSYIPVAPSDFIGPARTIALMLEAKAKALLAAKNPAAVKMLLYGPPGVAKTRLVEMFANRLAWHPTAVESINGRSVTIDTVRRWQESARYIPIGGQFVIKILNELDVCSPVVQDALLTCFDEAPPHTAFLGTSNLQLQMLSERFETRLQQFRVESPSTEEIADFLMKRWGFSKRQALEIAVGSGSNVRAALLDAQSILDVQRIAA